MRSKSLAKQLAPFQPPNALLVTSEAEMAHLQCRGVNRISSITINRRIELFEFGSKVGCVISSHDVMFVTGNPSTM